MADSCCNKSGKRRAPTSMLRVCVLGAMLGLASTSASALPIHILASGGLLTDGSYQGSFEIDFVFESSTADENPALGAFLATNAGSYTGRIDHQVAGGMNLQGTISQIESTVSPDDWRLTGEQDVFPGGSISFWFTNASGLTPDQIVPDLAGPLSATISIDFGVSVGLAPMNGFPGPGSVQVVIPEPATASLVAVGLLGLGAWARRRAR